MVSRTIYYKHIRSLFLAVDNDFAVFGIIEFPSKVGRRFLLVRTERDKLKLPGGKKNDDELPFQTLIREVREETGIKIDENEMEDRCIYFKSLPFHDFYVFRVVLPRAPRFPHRGITGEVPRIMSLEDIKANFHNLIFSHREALSRYMRLNLS